MPVNVSFHLTGPFTEDHGRWLADLIEELAPLCHIPDYDGPLQIVVFPKDGLPELINRLVDGGEYRVGPHAPSAAAVPRIADGALQCFILLSAEEVAKLRAESRPVPVVSSVLEELLHVRAYATRWLQLGYLDRPDPSERRAAIHQIGRGIHDEYFVCRRKTELAAALPVFDAPDQPGFRTTGLLSYGGDVLASLETASRALGDLADRVPWGRLMSEGALHEVGAVLYRHTFEPLARNAGFRDGTPPESRPADADLINESEFYRDWLAPYWPRMLVQLRVSYESDLGVMANVLLRLGGSLEQLIEDMDQHVRA